MLDSNKRLSEIYDIASEMLLAIRRPDNF